MRERERDRQRERERERADLYCPEDVPEAGSLLTSVFLGPVFVRVSGQLLQSLAKTVNIFSFVVLYKKMSCPFNAKTVTVTQIDIIRDPHRNFVYFTMYCWPDATVFITSSSSLANS